MNKKYYFSAFFVLIVLIVLFFTLRREGDNLAVNFLDVGQGDSILINNKMLIEIAKQGDLKKQHEAEIEKIDIRSKQI